jgi:hypothetical protein
VFQFLAVQTVPSRFLLNPSASLEVPMPSGYQT